MIDRTRGYFQREKETMSKRRREVYLQKNLSEILRYGYRYSKAIRSRFDVMGIKPERVKDLKDLEKLPITKKTDLVTAQKQTLPFGGFEVVPPKGMRRIYISPGPVFEPGEWDYKDIRWVQALFACGIRRGDIVLNTFNYHLTPLAFMLDESLKMLGASVVPVGPGNLSMQIQLMRQLHVSGFLGTPSLLMSVVEAAEGMSLDLRKDLFLKAAFVGAEMFPESLRQKLEGKLGILIRQVYGTVDVGCLGYECPEKTGMHIPEDVMVEIVDTETGKQLEMGATGEIVATTFSRIFPMIRFSTGDLSYLIKDRCPCGRTSPRLGKILGRTDQVTKVWGIFIHPWQADDVMAKFSEVANYQIVVNRKEYRDVMTVYIELKKDVADQMDLRGRVEKEIEEVLKVKGQVEFIQRGGIPDRAKKIDDRRIWE